MVFHGLSCSCPTSSSVAVPRCLQQGFQASIFSQNEIEQRLRLAGAMAIPPFAVRRNDAGTEIHIVFTSSPFGGAIIAGPRAELVTNVQGPWVRDVNGQIISRVSNQQIPIVFCPAFAKGADPEEDFSRLSDFAGTFLPQLPAGQHPRSFYCRLFGYCFSSDPSGLAFVGMEIYGDRFGQGVYTTRNGALHRDSYFFLRNVIGHCGYQVAVVGPYIVDTRVEEDALEVAFFKASEFEKAKTTNVTTIRHPVLRRPFEVADMDPGCQCLFLAKPSSKAPNARWYVLDLETGAWARVGTGGGYGLFLRAEAASFLGKKAAVPLLLPFRASDARMQSGMQ